MDGSPPGGEGGPGRKSPPPGPALPARGPVRTTGPRSARVVPRPLPSLSRIRALRELGEDETALHELDRLLRAQPKNGKALALRGRLQLDMGLYRAALADLEAAAAAGEEGLADLLARADALVRLHRYPEAEEVLDRVRVSGARRTLLHVLLAEIRADQGREEEARREVREALRLDARNPRALLLARRLGVR